MAHGFLAMNLTAAAGRDSRALLSPVLQRVQPQVGHLGAFRITEDGDYPTFLVKLIEHTLPVRFRKQLSVVQCPKPPAWSPDCESRYGRRWFRQRQEP